MKKEYLKSRVLALVLTIASLAVGQGAWATVTGTGTENDPFVVDSWADLKEKMAAGGYIRLDADVTDLENTNTSYLNVPAGISVTLDLNGHKIDRNLTEASNDGHVIQVKGMETNLGSLTIRDSQGGGTITGGFTSSGGGAGGIYVYYGNLTLESGSICGNKCTGFGGGGIRLAGSGSTFTMTGGSITGNVANTGKNSEAECGGAIFFYGSGEVHISGGSITDNYCHATNYGCAGIGGYTNTTLHTEKTYLSGTYTLSGNLKGTYDEVNGVWTNPVASDYMHGKYDDIYISGVISPTAATAIDLYNGNVFSWTTRPRLTNNWATHMGYTDADGYFTLVASSESSGKIIGVRDGNLYIGTPEAALWHADNSHDGSTEAKAYIISTPKGLDLLAKQVNGTDGYDANNFTGKFFKLGNDIAYSGNSENYTAIGTSSNQFKGTFDGNGNIVSGICINQGTTDYQGLFGYVGSGGTVKNVIVTDASIVGKADVGVVAGQYAGTLTANYYRGCTVNSKSTNIGTGTGDINGAQAVYTLTLTTGITATATAAVNYNATDYYTAGTDITLDYNGTPPTGYLFSSYIYNDGADHAITGNSFQMPASDVTVNPVWTASTYTVTLDNQSATTAGTASVTATYDSAMPAITVPTRTGYTFGGYYTEANGGGTQYYNADGSSANNWNIAAATTLYAQWTANTYAVTLDNQGATTAGTTEVTATYGAAMPAITVPTMTGYTFGGYYTEANGGGTKYYNADGSSANNWNIAGATTLYAQWTASTYTVTLNNQGATTAGTTEVTATYDAAMPAITVPERTGYTFGGYYTETNGGGTKYYNADGSSANNWNIAAATTLYAQWHLSYVNHDGEQTIDDYTYIENGIENYVVTDANDGFFVVKGNVTLDNLTISGRNGINTYANIIVPVGTSLTVNNGIVRSGEYNSLGTYGQVGGAGTITAKSIDVNLSLSINSVTLTVDNPDGDAIKCHNFELYSGTVVVKSQNGCGIKNEYTFLYGGTLTVNSEKGCGLYSESAVYLNGGNVTIMASKGYDGIRALDIEISASNNTDRIKASSYHADVRFSDPYEEVDDPGKVYLNEISNTQKAAIAGRTLKPFNDFSKTFNITYVVNGGTMPVSYPKTYDYNTTVNLPIPTREDYCFVGWYEEENFSGDPITEIAEKEYLGDLTLYAKWGPVSIDVSYIDENNQKSTVNAIVLYGSNEATAEYPGGIYTITEDKVGYNKLTFTGNTTIILPDGKELYRENEDMSISVEGDFTIYGQEAGYGTLFASKGITVTSDVAYYGGIFAASSITAGSGNGNITLDWRSIKNAVLCGAYNGHVTFNKSFAYKDADDNLVIINAGAVNDNTTINEKMLLPYAEYVDISYIDKDGKECTANAKALYGNESNFPLPGGTYTFMRDAKYESLSFSGNTTLIVPDDSYVTIYPKQNHAVAVVNGDLAIYGQARRNGKFRVSAAGSTIGSMNVQGDLIVGNLAFRYSSETDITVNNATIAGGDFFVSSNVIANGGNGNITLGYHHRLDHIYIGACQGNVSIMDGCALYNDTEVLLGSIANNKVNQKELQPCLLLDGNADNSSKFAVWNDSIDVAYLHNRTLYKDGDWNTLCLPFSLSDWQIAGSELADATIMEFDAANSGLNGKTLTLNFKAAESIKAGIPYIIKWSGTGENIVNPVFTELSSAAQTTPVNVASTYVDFVGIYAPISFTSADNTKLLVGTQNKLYYPLADASIGACRAYFQLNGITVGDPNSSAPIQNIVLNFGDGETTEIKTTDFTDYTDSGAWYDMQGRKLDQQPTQKGLYIHNGRKTVIK